VPLLILLEICGAASFRLGNDVARRMTFGDAVLAREADRYGAEAIVTWNVKDFAGRVAVPVCSPEDFTFPGEE
jgi:hypothetical protein